MSAHDQVIQDVYAREVVMARVGHLIRRKQQEIERITRILRNSVPFEESAVPVEGKIQKIVLIGPYPMLWLGFWGSFSPMWLGRRRCN
ncbi:hypothetical protein [Sphingomonas elodea]|uniref:hypothetical protein n=1 Tax=Sphingomonas elodea TaxID=179878 RepID=UPI0011105E87|nr:hypothetical protein [Sphingomonas elodea]